jgi:hypothetical protein
MPPPFLPSGILPGGALVTEIIAGLRGGPYAAFTISARLSSNAGAPMFRFLAAGWLTRRLARPISRLIPNPYLRAAAIAGAGVFASRLLKVGPAGGGRAPRR